MNRKGYKLNNRCRCGKIILDTSKSCYKCGNKIKPRGLAINKIHHFSEEHKRKIGLSNKGKILSKKTKRKISLSKKGHKMSLEARRNISNGHKGIKHPNWKGGITDLNTFLRRSWEMKVWRETIFKRDKFTCQICNKGSNRLHADHIIPFSFLVREGVLLKDFSGVFDLDNGRTLCEGCHKKTDTYMYRAKHHINNKLFDALYIYWSENTDKSIDFDIFYKQKIEQYIDLIKEKLERTVAHSS